MTSPEARILELYRAFNGRDFDGFFSMLSPRVDWTNDTDDSRLIGKDALRAYILDETAVVRAEFAPILVQTLDDGDVSVLAQQTILSTADGSVWSDTRVRHTFRLEGDLVVRMDSERDVRAADAHVEPLLTSLYEAIERHDVDAVLALFHRDARIPDSLEQTALVGRDQIRAYYQRQFEAIRVGSSLLATNLLPDGRVEAFLHVLVQGSTGGFWWEGRITATYRIEDGLITEMVVTEPPEAEMRHERSLLAKAYEAFNARDPIALGEVLHEDVQWPDSLEGGLLKGRAAVIDYFARQFDLMQLDARQITVREEPPARIVVDIQYAVKSRDGQLWSDTRAVLAYDFADRLIIGMTVLKGL